VPKVANFGPKLLRQKNSTTVQELFKDFSSTYLFHTYPHDTLPRHVIYGSGIK